MNRSFDSGLTAAEDSSLNRIRRIVGHSLAVNDAQWTHFMRTTGQLKAALAWINNTKPTTSLLFYVLMPNATLQAAAFLPVKGNFSKTTFFIKTTATPVSSANFDDVRIHFHIMMAPSLKTRFISLLCSRKQVVIHADMPANLIEFTATAMQSIYAPLLCNPPTRLNWPPETCTDVDAGLQKISRQIHDVASERRSHRRRQHVKFELNASICWSTVAAAVQTFSRSRGDNFEMHNVVEQAVIALCIDLEAALRASEPVVVVADSGFIGINDECSRWQERWCFMRSMNDTLRGVNAAVVSEMLGAFGSVAYLRSFETILQMVETQSVHVIGVVSFMRALANQLRSIQTASLEDMLNMVGPIVHCWSKMCSQEFATSGVFVPSDAIRVIRSVCDEFMLEIRRTLDLGGGMWQQVQAQDVQKFHCAEQILQRLRQAVIAKIQQHLGSEQPAKSGALQRLRRFAQRLQQIRGVLEAALDYRNIGYLAIICGGTQVSSGQLLQLVDVHRGLLVNYSIQSAADLWDIDGDCVGFEKCTNAHRVSVCDLNETVIQAFDAVVVNCRTAEHCKQV